MIMSSHSDQQFGAVITRLIRNENLTRQESRDAFVTILNDETTEMQQGAFLAALTAKGETEAEVAGAWEAIYELDTQKVSVNSPTPLVENSGTGMDSFKTFNISTAASVIAASGGIKMVRHGARAISSVCGTVDIAEALGVDVECSAELVAASVNKAGIGLFNGMSAQIHPKALGRILSKIFFGSTLNIAASLANPASPARGIRGVYSKEMVLPVTNVMRAIGYERALVFFGGIDNSDKGMDEASVCGETYCAELESDGSIKEFTFHPSDYDLKVHNPADLSPDTDIRQEAQRFVDLIRGRKNGARKDAAILNAGLIFYIADKADGIAMGVQHAAAVLESGDVLATLENWVAAQNRNPQKGCETLQQYI
jgi:anthranilate phosphoribosyltransferase